MTTSLYLVAVGAAIVIAITIRPRRRRGNDDDAKDSILTLQPESHATMSLRSKPAGDILGGSSLSGMDTALAGVTGPPDDRALYGIADSSAFRRGGVGVVYEATLLRERLGYPAGTKVGLKLLTAIDADRFAKLSGRTVVLRDHPHPHMASILESFVGPPLTMEKVDDADCNLYYSVHIWVDGSPLTEHIAAASASEILDWMDDIGQVVDHLHSLHDGGFAHRDIHARNIIIEPDGHACLIDFDTILWGEADDTVLTSLHSASGFIGTDRRSAAQAQDRSMFALTLLRALARDIGGVSPIASLVRGSLRGAVTNEVDAPTSAIAKPPGDTLVAFLLRSIRQPPAQANDIVVQARQLTASEMPSRLIKRIGHRSARLDLTRELAHLSGHRPRARRSRNAVIFALIAVAIAAATTTYVISAHWGFGAAHRQPQDRNVNATAVLPAFSCWDNTRKLTLESCGRPQGLDALARAFRTPSFDSSSCEQQDSEGDLIGATCSFAGAGIEPISGIWDLGASEDLGGGLNFLAQRTYQCTYECHDWIVAGELTGRIEIERVGRNNTWDVTRGPANLKRVTVFYNNYDVLLDFFTTDVSSIDTLLNELNPRPASAMPGTPIRGTAAVACWNGTSAAKIRDCPALDSEAGLIWAFPGLSGRLQRCEDHSEDLERLWICTYSDLGITDGPVGHPLSAQIYVGFDSGMTGAARANQDLNATVDAGQKVDSRTWTIGGANVGTIVRSSVPSVDQGVRLVSLGAGYEHAPFWFSAGGLTETQVESVLTRLHPRAILSERG